jgi:gluconolactonase
VTGDINKAFAAARKDTGEEFAAETGGSKGVASSMKSLIIGVVLLFCLPITVRTQGVSREFQLRAKSPKFWKLIGRHAQLKRIATGFGFTEGPVWDPHGFLYVSDEIINKIFRVYPDGHKETLIELGDPDGSTFDHEFHLLDCASVLRAIIQIDPDGHYKVLADHYQGKRFNSPNDVVIGPDGAIYFTDPTLDLPKGKKQEIPFQGIYRLDAQGNIQLLAHDMAQPNGLAFSPDGKKLYVDDSKRKDIRVYDFLPGGKLVNGRLFGREEGGPHQGVPDGMRVDRKGNLFVVGPLGVWVWDPEGNHLGTIVVPEQPANLTWGDADYRTLYITATTSVYRIRTRVRGFVPYLSKARHH